MYKYQPFLRFQNVSFTYPDSINPAVKDLTFDLGQGWTAFAGANGCGKTTALLLACGFLVPDKGSVTSSGRGIYCPQRTDTPPDQVEEFLQDWSGEAITLRRKLNILDDWLYRWDTLSHGERKRLQIAVALWGKPAVLALDEPLNHLDLQGRLVILRAMIDFQGCGVLVSHDRRAIDDVCRSTVLFRSDTVRLYHSGYTMAVEQEERERNFLVRKRREATEDYRKKKRDARRKMLKARTIQAHATGNRVSFKDICKFNLDGASRVDGIVQKAGQRSREAARKADRAKKRMESITYRKVHRTGIKLQGEQSGRNYLLDAQPSKLSVGKRVISLPQLYIGRESRIALTGSNGSGKSTLLSWLKPVLNCPEDKLIWIPQEITAEESSSRLDQARALSGERLGEVMTLVRRLGSDPERVLDSSLPSPGETRKLILAMGLSLNPWLVVMDEPTNHMDLPSISCLEKALNDYHGALLLVSHDRQFLEKTTEISWLIAENALHIEYSSDA